MSCLGHVGHALLLFSGEGWAKNQERFLVILGIHSVRDDCFLLNFLLGVCVGFSTFTLQWPPFLCLLRMCRSFASARTVVHQPYWTEIEISLLHWVQKSCAAALNCLQAASIYTRKQTKTGNLAKNRCARKKKLFVPLIKTQGLLRTVGGCIKHLLWFVCDVCTILCLLSQLFSLSKAAANTQPSVHRKLAVCFIVVKRITQSVLVGFTHH